MKETGCCKIFDPKPWENKTIKWKDKLFVKDHVICFLHIPLNFGGVMKRNMKKIEDAKACSNAPIVLSDDKSLWGSDVYISVTKKIPESEMANISGTFLTKVFEGHYKNVGKWMTEMKEYVKSKKKEVKQFYTFYTTCPKCSKEYGKNYVVILAKI
ncbi:MAG: hypothetical protein ISS36_02770 [Candidatus Aenigmarchaeota archaeon]|nr:hypothetical protein [Candidatus Aenigmarchaeota archaeon]